MLKKFVISFLVFVMLIGFGSQAKAYFEESHWVAKPTYNQRMVHKLIFGVGNLTCGWVEIVQEPYEAVKRKEMFWRGVSLGIFNGIVDTIGGALHILTFPVTPLDIELPEGGALRESYIMPQNVTASAAAETGENNQTT